jgi:threonine dehydratase
MISLQDVQYARRLIEPYVRKTPLERNSTLSQRLGTNVYLKLEIFQKTGSFKPRGAFNQILQLSREQREKGVVAASGGNFAQGVAYAGKTLGIPTLICMPAYTPENYIEATKAYGAIVELAPNFPETLELAHSHQQEGLSFLHPWENPNQMAGNGTIGMELLEDLPDLTDVIISIGGGGLIAGIMVAIKSIKPDVRIWGVETEGADTMGRALQAGKVVQVTPTSLAKTLGAPYVAEDALLLAQKHLEQYILVSDKEAFEAELFLMERAKVITELAASCTLAAADRLNGTFGKKDQVVLLLCGGNASLDNLMDYHQQFGFNRLSHQ